MQARGSWEPLASRAEEVKRWTQQLIAGEERGWGGRRGGQRGEKGFLAGVCGAAHPALGPHNDLCLVSS